MTPRLAVALALAIAAYVVVFVSLARTPPAYHGRAAGDRAQFGRPVEGKAAQPRLFS